MPRGALPLGRGTSEPVTYGLAQALTGNGSDGDGMNVGAIEQAQHAEQIGSGLGKLTARAEVGRDTGLPAPTRSEAQPGLAGFCIFGIEPDMGPGGVMGREHAGCHRLVAGALRPLGERKAEHVLDHVPRQAAGTQHRHAIAEAGQDGRFDADLGGAPIHDGIDAAIEIGSDMGGHGGTDMTGAIGRGRGDRPADGLEHGMGHGMIGHAQSDAVEPGGRDLADRAARRLRHHQSQWSRPERQRQAFGRRREDALTAGELERSQMSNQRIEARPPLGLVDAGDRSAIGGIGAQAIDRFGGKGDQPALGQDAPGLRQGGWVGPEMQGVSICHPGQPSALLLIDA